MSEYLSRYELAIYQIAMNETVRFYNHYEPGRYTFNVTPRLKRVLKLGITEIQDLFKVSTGKRALDIKKIVERILIKDE